MSAVGWLPVAAWLMGALGHGDTLGLSAPGQVAVRSSNDWHGIKNYAISFHPILQL